MKEAYQKEIRGHYGSIWSGTPRVLQPVRGRAKELPDNFRVLEYASTVERNVWVYATMGMSQPNEADSVELHLFSPVECPGHVDVLAMIAHFHRSGEKLGKNHTVSLGIPWMTNSLCNCALLSPPFPDGERMTSIKGAKVAVGIQFLWVMPITQAERAYAVEHGIEEFWARFDETPTNYLDVLRKSVV